MPIKKAVILVCLTGLLGCGPKYLETSTTPDIEKFSVNPIALIPLEVEPTTAGGFRSATVENNATATITDQLYRKLVERRVKVKRFDTPIQIDPEITMDDRRMIEQAQQIGRQLQMPAVLFGAVTAFFEREGNAYGIRRPATVGFTVRLINTEDGLLLWKAGYYETQKSLLEDITAAGLFFRRRGRWLTAAELSEDGLEQILADSPWRKTRETDADHPGD